LEKNVRFWLIMGSLLIGIIALFRLIPLQIELGFSEEGLTFIIIMNVLTILTCYLSFSSDKYVMFLIMLFVITEIVTVKTIFDLSLFDQISIVITYPPIQILCMTLVLLYPKMMNQLETNQE